MTEEFKGARPEKLKASDLKNSQTRYIVLALVLVAILTVIGVVTFLAVTNYFISTP